MHNPVGTAFAWASAGAHYAISQAAGALHLASELATPQGAVNFTEQSAQALYAAGQSFVSAHIDAYNNGTLPELLGHDFVSAITLGAPMLVAPEAESEVLAAGMPEVAAENVVPYTEEGIANIEQHLNNLDALADNSPNQAMLARLKAGFTDPQDLMFYEHETIESGIFNDLNPGNLSPESDEFQSLAEQAHMQTLEQQGIAYAPGYQAQLYHPSVIAQYPDAFSPATRLLAGVP